MFYLSARWKPGGGKLSRRGSARQLLTAAGGSERCGGAGPGRCEPGPCCALGGGCLGVLAPRRAREGKRPLPGGERACRQRDQTALFSSSKKPPIFLSLSLSLPTPPPLFFLFFSSPTWYFPLTLTRSIPHYSVSPLHAPTSVAARERCPGAAVGVPQP